MKLENEFTVDVPVEDVWDVLLDLERITPCLPGAALTNGSNGDGEHDGLMKVKLGPVTQEYKGTVQIQEADESARRAVLQADGKDSRGGSPTAWRRRSRAAEEPRKRPERTPRRGPNRPQTAKPKRDRPRAGLPSRGAPNGKMRSRR